MDQIKPRAARTICQCFFQRCLIIAVLLGVCHVYAAIILYQTEGIKWSMEIDFKRKPAIARDVLHGKPSLANNTQETINEEYMEDFYYQMEQQRRLQLLDEACQRLNFSRSPNNYGEEYTLHLIVDDKYKMLFNYIPKVSCTTWKGVFGKLHRTHSKGNYRRLKNYTLSEIQYRLEHYQKALFVREPVTRLLSAYLNKFRNMKTMQKTWEKMFGHKIVRTYRKEYAQIYLKKWNPGNESMHPDTFLNITLPEFIQFITDKGDSTGLNEISDHFLPLHKVSHPCAIHYDFIGHFENLTTEAPYMLKFLGVDHAVQYPEFHASAAVKSLIDEYEMVPLHLLKRLQNYYRYDYELFGYSFDGTLRSIVEGLFNDDEDD